VSTVAPMSRPPPALVPGCFLTRVLRPAERGHPEGPGDGASAGQHPEDQRPLLQGGRPSLRRPAGADLPGHAERLQVSEREHLLGRPDQR